MLDLAGTIELGSKSFALRSGRLENTPGQTPSWHVCCPPSWVTAFRDDALASLTGATCPRWKGRGEGTRLDEASAAVEVYQLIEDRHEKIDSRLDRLLLEGSAGSLATEAGRSRFAELRELICRQLRLKQRTLPRKAQAARPRSGDLERTAHPRVRRLVADLQELSPRHSGE